MSIDRAILFRLATSSRLERHVRALPQGEHLAWRAASRYVAGTTAAEAFQVCRQLDERGVGSSLDQFGELVHDASAAEEVAADCRQLADKLAELPEDAWLSIDLSHSDWILSRSGARSTWPPSRNPCPPVGASRPGPRTTTTPMPCSSAP